MKQFNYIVICLILGSLSGCWSFIPATQYAGADFWLRVEEISLSRANGWRSYFSGDASGNVYFVVDDRAYISDEKNPATYNATVTQGETSASSLSRHQPLQFAGLRGRVSTIHVAMVESNCRYAVRQEAEDAFRQGASAGVTSNASQRNGSDLGGGRAGRLDYLLEQYCNDRKEKDRVIGTFSIKVLWSDDREPRWQASCARGSNSCRMNSSGTEGFGFSFGSERGRYDVNFIVNHN